MGMQAASFFWTEMIYSLIIIICSLMIYFGTKELYELSSHKGIKYFRQAFLFFALAYFFRSTIKLFLNYFGLKHAFDIMPKFFVGPLALFVFMYFISMAIFYLVYSVLRKKLDPDSPRIFLFHFLALIMAIISIVFRSPFTHIVVNTLLLLFVAYAVYISYRDQKSKKGINLYIIYLLLMFFSILNILDLLIPTPLYFIQVIIYSASSFIFLLILYKVLKKTGGN